MSVELVGEIGPHPLDSSFGDCRNTDMVDRGLENNLCYRHACEAAAVAFDAAAYRRHGEVGPSPARAARMAFLRAINPTWGHIYAANPALEVPPHPLDSAFENATRARRVDKGLEDNSTYQRALLDAVDAHRSAQNRPTGQLGASPARAARVAFLQALDPSL